MDYIFVGKNGAFFTKLQNRHVLQDITSGNV